MWRNLDIEAHKNMAHKVEVKGHVVKVECEFGDSDNLVHVLYPYYTLH